MGSEEAGGTIGRYFISFISMLFIIAASRWTANFMKNRKVSKTVNIGICIVLVIILCFVRDYLL